MSDLLTLEGVHTHIGRYHILQGVDLVVPRGGFTVLLGRNGAGKTTTLRTIMGLWRASQGRIRFAGEDFTARPTPDIASAGIAYVPENMGIFTGLTVRENFVLAARAGRVEAKRIEWIFSLFPALERFYGLAAGALSGGQKQMLSIARALIEPRELILVDEPTKGLAPAIVNNMIRAFREVKKARRHRAAGRAEFHGRAHARRHRRGDGRRPRGASRLDGGARARPRAAAEAPGPASGVASMSDTAVRQGRSPRRRAALRLDSGAAGARGGAGGAAARRQFPDLGHAHRRGARHGHDDLHHGLGADARVRPDGRDQFRPRRFHLARRLYEPARAVAAFRLGEFAIGRAERRRAAALHPARHGGDRPVRLGVRARDRAAGLWPAPEADPRHHGRADRGRAIDPRVLRRRARSPSRCRRPSAARSRSGRRWWWSAIG